MLTGVWRVCTAVIACFTFSLMATVPARAEVTCGPGQVWDGYTCVVVVLPPSDDGGGGATLKDSGGRSGVKRKCFVMQGGKRVEAPCSMGDGHTWNPAKGCYVRVKSPQPPKSAPVWEGRKDGVILECFMPGMGSYTPYDFWAQVAPSANAPDPKVLARRAVAAMDLSAIRIGIVPEARAGRVGLVGLPVWLWVDEPDEHTWGPVSRTASSGGYSVTASARVARMRWQLGNGRVVSCADKGTPYRDSFGMSQSPTCGFAGYIKAGRYTVTATAYWEVDWEGMGQAGTITFQLTRSAQIVVGELQVVNR